jgi:hypothetical protein
MEAVNGNSLDATKARLLGTDSSQGDSRIFHSSRRLIGGVRWPHQQNTNGVKPAGIAKANPELCVARQKVSVSFVPPQGGFRQNILKPSPSQKFNRSWSTTSTTAPTMTPSSSEVELAAGSEYSVSTGAFTPPPSTPGESTPQRYLAPSVKRALQPKWR